ncbi:MAG TPA: universal stress protein [Actinomycetota bacterium]|nr:universal stress protein [Actinomycetota bacterium]
MRILLATDGGRHSEIVLEMLGRLGDRGRVEIHVLTVNGFEFAMRHAGAAGHYSFESAQADAQRIVDETVAGVKDLGFTADGEAVEGDEATEILRIADDRAVGLILVGSAKERWVDTVVLGSVSSSVVHGTERPVMVVHEAPSHEGPVKVLAATDGSDGAERAVRAFAGLADPERCTVEVLSVAPAPPLPAGGPAGAVVDAPEFTERGLDAAREHAEAGASILRDAGFSVTATALPGAPVRAILERCEDEGHHLVVVGARGLGRFRAKVLGSVSDRILRKAPASLIGR